MTLDEVIKDHLIKTYERSFRDKRRTARVLGVSVDYVYQNLAKYGVIKSKNKKFQKPLQ